MRDPEREQENRAPTAVPIQVHDRRPRFDAEPGDDSASKTSSPSPRYPTVVAGLEERARAAEGKLSEALDLLRRKETEADEFRARLRREMEKRAQVEVEKYLREILEVVDSLDRGVASAETDSNPASLRLGLVQVRDQFLSVLARQGIAPMSLVGTAYDPHLAEAVAVASVDDESQDGIVLDEIRRGFTLRGQTLRPAHVRIARKSPSDPREPEASRAS
ncbi:MAG TPA: nucleotide exchange factor GrpE [Candidatus Polarisedimenticolia bacterium]|jgi:molecular chaperone GrpE|nr:nucleotide exchange factor GrpE [Candidatus Polarisedimenticolia bacterium]